jgi:hypothetical protein
MDRYKLRELITEARKKISVGSSKNTAIADHFEALAALHIHENTAAKNNQDKNYHEKIKVLKERINKNAALLDKDQIEDNAERSKRAANSYMDSLERNHGIKKEDIIESHHTPHGISHIIGREVDRKSNPHDILIKTKTNRYHGSSLKRGSATESNFGVSKISKHHEHESDPKNRILSGLSDIWNKGKQKAKFTKLDKKGLKLWQARKDVIKIHQDTQREAADHHASSFNSANHETQKKHIKHLLKGEPDIPYDRTSAVTGASIPHNKTRSAITLSKAKKFHAESRNNITHIYALDDTDKKIHVASVEHRSTHGPFKSMQANVKVKETKS